MQLNFWKRAVIVGGTSLSVRSGLRSGDMGAIIAAHGKIIGEECGFDRSFEAYVARGLLEFVDEGEPGRIWVVCQEEQVKGSLALHLRPTSQGQLRWFWLDPHLRGAGLGGALLERSIREARDADLSHLFLWTVAGLEAAAYLYRRHGFELTRSEEKSQWGRRIQEERYELEL